MEFCPKCKSMMMPIKNIYRCRKCGFEKEIKENIVSKTEIKEREVTILEKREMGLPTTKARCQSHGLDLNFEGLGLNSECAVVT